MVSRALHSLDREIVRSGQGRNSRYALVSSIHGLPGIQPVSIFDDQGAAHRLGALAHLGKDQFALQLEAGGQSLTADVPWPLASLKQEGFLGRLISEDATVKALFGTDIDRWPSSAHFFVAITRGFDMPGALMLGAPEPRASILGSTDGAKRSLEWDAITANLTASVQPGSSAGGEQPKFLATVDGPEPHHVIVKYSPPHGTPYGIRWNDLLRAEATALQTLASAGEPTATSAIVSSDKRLYLESHRFDRVGRSGRRHVVALGAVHDAFVSGPRMYWVPTCEELARQRRLSKIDADRVRLWRAFGRLIANTDMHFGNVSLFVEDFRAGTFTLAPCYDMLPMMYRPGPHEGNLGPLPFTPPTPNADERQIWPQAVDLAASFWTAASNDVACSEQWRNTCLENAKCIMS